MKRFLALLLAILSLNLSFAQSQQRENLKKDVYYLSSDALEGRKVGSVGNSLAREYICSQLDSLKIEYYIQNFAVDLGSNIVAEIRAEKPLYNSEYIVIGAHYDHLGIKNNKIYNGADDNASGSAMLLQLARLLSANADKINRHIILIWFDAEEMGLLGSDHFAYNPMFVDKLSDIKLMINLDMVGWYKNGALEIANVAMLNGWKEIFESTKTDLKTKVSKYEKSVFTDSDYSSFAKRDIPAITMTTGTDSPYHKPEDDAELIDYDGMDKICDFVYGLTVNASNYKDLGYSGKKSRKHYFKREGFEFGINLGIGSCNQYYNSGNITGRNGFSANSGFMIQYNIDEIQSLDLAVNANIERSKQVEGKFNAMKISVPLTYTFGYFDRAAGMGIKLGVAYDYIVKAELENTLLKKGEYNPHDIGLIYGFTLRIGKIGLNYLAKFGFLDRYNKDVKITYRETLFGLTYYF